MRKETNNNVNVYELVTNLGIIYFHSSEILYIKAAEKKCIVYCITEKKYVVNHSIKKLIELLPIPPFYRVHASYILNCRFVEYINSNVILIYNSGKHEVPLSRSRTQKFKEFMVNYKLLIFK
jgi:DNA-binding LytR/AlgR family response regulator